jgi:hypothetical protein
MKLGLGAVMTSVRAAYRQVEFRRQVKLTVEHKRLVALGQGRRSPDRTHA